MIPVDPTYHIAAEAAETADEEQSLLHRLGQGDSRAFWDIWQQYQNDFFSRYSLRWMGNNREDAEDALSEASLKAWQRLQAADQEITNIKGWLSRLLHNHCIDSRRAQKRRVSTVQLVDDIDAVATTGAAVLESVEDTVLRHEMHLYIQQAIDNLPPRLREPSRLRFFHDMSYRDIAAHLNLSADNVRKRLQQARTLLQAALRAYLSDDRVPGGSWTSCHTTTPLGLGMDE